MKKPSLLFVNNNMEIGGIQKALVNLLNEIHDQYDITLFLYYKSGELLCQVPEDVKIMEANPLLKLLGMSCETSGKMGGFYHAIRAGMGIYSRLINHRLPIFLCIHSAKKMRGYDVAISYMQNAGKKVFYGGGNNLVLKKVEAKEKITFLHCDFKNYEGNTAYNRKLYEKFDKIVAVSQSGKNAFVSCMPELSSKAVCVYNCYRYDEMDEEAAENPLSYDTFSLVTIARLGEEKGLVRCIAIMKQLKEDGLNFTWHVIGDGACWDVINSMIKSEGLSDCIIMHGAQKNPYRYLKNASLLFVPSYHEGAPMVFCEAAHFGVPILTTNTSSAEEMVKDKGYGFVCENSEERIYTALKHILSYPDVYEACRQNLRKPCNNKEAVSQFATLISSKKFS